MLYAVTAALPRPIALPIDSASGPLITSAMATTEMSVTAMSVTTICIGRIL